MSGRLEAAQRRVGRRVGGEEALDAELVQGDVVRRAEAGESREELEVDAIAAELDGEGRGEVSWKVRSFKRCLIPGECTYEFLRIRDALY